LQKAEDPVIVTAEMLSTINGTNSCQPCDVYTEKQRIGSKKDRVHSTDYIVIYDASLKNDAYTICKHVFEKKQGVLYERYVKVNPKMFAPGVGSQIKFEVVNQPLNRPIKITVDEQDLFNSGASQFSSLISGLVNTNIITPVSSSGKDGEQSGAKGSLITTILDVISVQVLNYVMQFKISSCSLLEHQNNLAGIISNINRVYSINATNSAELYAQLKSKIETEIEGEQNVANALKKLDAIIAALRSLENLQPIAYTTLRAKNRDYIEIKYTDANNVMSKPENIRISGGMKIDFSGGFILTGLRDYTYVLKDATVRYTPQGSSVERDTTGNIIVKEEDGNNQVGVCLLSHFYPRISSHYNLGGTVGLMTSTNLNLRVMLGGSLLISSLFGSNNRITFSGGVVWGKVKRLSTQHNDYFNQARFVNNIPQFYSASAAPTPIDKSERSWFFAITMNFGGN